MVLRTSSLLVPDFDFECVHPRIEERPQAGSGAKIDLELSAPAVSCEVNRSKNLPVIARAGIMRAVPGDAGKAVHLVVHTTIDPLAVHEKRTTGKDGHRVRFEHLALPALRTQRLLRVNCALAL